MDDTTRSIIRNVKGPGELSSSPSSSFSILSPCVFLMNELGAGKD